MKLLIALMFLAPSAFAGGSNDKQTQAVYTDEGRNPVPFNVACTSYTWTVVVSSDAIRRDAFMESMSADNTVGVCLSTAATANASCGSTTNGPEMAPGDRLTLYNTSGYWCECRTGASCTIKGNTDEDKGDYGNRSAAATQ